MLSFKHMDPFIQSFWDWRRSEHSNVLHLAATQDLLSRLALLGKAWYSVAVTFLYARPLLRSAYQVRCLRHTLERSSSFRSIVFSLVVMSPGRGRVKSPHRWCSDTVKEVRVTEEDINIIFELCSTEDHAIESILLSTAPEPPHIPYAPIKLVPKVLRQEWPLRKLVVHGCADHTWFGKVDLPQLEVLHLRCYVFNRFSTFPFLPRLTTELVQCYFSQQARFFFGEYYCPSLRSLGYYQCIFLGQECLFLLRYLPSLEQFCFVEEARKSPLLIHMIHRSQPVDHLVFGIRFWERSIHLPRCRLPESRKSLTIVALRGPRKCPVEDVLQCLIYNLNWDRGLPSLRLIRVVGHIHATPTFDYLCSFCARHEIEVVYEGEGKFQPLLSGAKID